MTARGKRTFGNRMIRLFDKTELHKGLGYIYKKKQIKERKPGMFPRY